MTDTMKCLACAADIETDSCYCDQCGKEIFLCEACAQPGDQKFCVFDGGNLVSAKLKHATSITIHNNTAATAASVNIPVTPTPVTGMAVPAPKLTLVNHNLNLMIEIQPDTILGRNTGPYVDSLQGFPAISGKHVVFKYQDSLGWAFEDVGSTNGTKYSTSNLMWGQVARCEANTLVPIQDKAFLLIANIEFAIEATQPVLSPSSSTQRL